MKYFANVVSLMLQLKTFTWNEMAFTVLNSLNLPELVVTECKKTICEYVYQYLLVYLTYQCLVLLIIIII